LGRVLNFAILLAALGLGLVVFRNFYPRKAESPAYKIVAGAHLTIPGVDFGSSERTVLLALSKTCKYCSESAPFYKRFNAAIKNSKVRLIALLPENQEGGESYLQELGISANEVRNVSLAALGITILPTLVITDNAGTVLETWKGKLPPRVEAVVFKSLHLPETRPESEWLIHESELDGFLKRNQGAIVLDVRDRESFSRKHVPQAVNIPLDELPVRAGNELSTQNIVVVRAEDDFQGDLAYSVLDGQGFSRILTLLPTAPGAVPEK
jgi:hypothetical protein